MRKASRLLLLVLALVSFSVATVGADCIDEGSPDCEPVGEEQLQVENTDGAYGYGVTCWTVCTNAFGGSFWSWRYFRRVYLTACMTSGTTTYCGYK